MISIPVTNNGSIASTQPQHLNLPVALDGMQDNVHQYKYMGS